MRVTTTPQKNSAMLSIYYPLSQAGQKYVPNVRILGTQSPTKIPCSFAISELPKNHRETLKQKLANAATKK